jgi:hypothetical protein
MHQLLEKLMDIVKERERVAEMCSWCEIEHQYRRADGTSQWYARMWCNAIGEKVVGQGNTAWEAVQSAHALHEMHGGRG